MTEGGTTETVARIEDHPFFEGFDPKFLRWVSVGMVERTYEPGELLVREGAPAKEFLLIISGKVALEMATPERPRLTIQTVGPGEVIGWSWLVPPRRWTLDGRAIRLTRAFDLDGEVLRRELDAHPAEGYRFLSRVLPVLAERLENTRLQLLDIHGV